MKTGKDITRVVEEYLCCSCGVCYTACNFDAISFHETSGGYLFPQIDYDKCTACGLCYRVCPGIHFGPGLRSAAPDDPFRGHVLSAWVGRGVDEELFRNSQSGGLASALLAALFEADRIDAAVVAVMRAEVPPRGDVKLIRSRAELREAQKSKYTPIPLLRALKEVEQQKLRTAVVGLPCHMHGLQNLLDIKTGLKPHIVFKLGLVCEHILLSTAIDYFGRRAGAAEVTDFVFKDKTKPEYPGNTVVTDIHGKQIQLNDSIRRGIKDFFTPARCRLCFDKLNIYADAVAADPHGVQGIDRVNGETLLLLRTESGRQVLDAAVAQQQVTVRSADTDAAFKGQGLAAKQRDWSGYMQAWEQLGYTLPAYSIQAKAEAEAETKAEAEAGAASGKYRRALQHALKLDSLSSKEQLYKRADRYLFKKVVRKKLRSMSRKLFKVGKK